MSQTTRGTIKTIFQEEQFKNNFRKQQIVLTTQDKYPQHILFEFINDNINLLKGYMEGEEVELNYNLRGKENAYKGKPINSLAVWKIGRLVGEVTNAQQNEGRQEVTDLPF